MCCFIRISKILLYAIHNLSWLFTSWPVVVLSGFQRYFCMQYTTNYALSTGKAGLFYQDFKDTFVCNTQLSSLLSYSWLCCFIRISKILLYAIHNMNWEFVTMPNVVLSGFQRYFCMQYTTSRTCCSLSFKLFYQDFKDTFVCNTQPLLENIMVAQVVLSGFQRYFCMQYTTYKPKVNICVRLFYQDFKDTFVCNTQRRTCRRWCLCVVLSGFQRYFCMQYTTYQWSASSVLLLFYQDFKDTFVCNTQHLVKR